MHVPDWQGKYHKSSLGVASKFELEFSGVEFTHKKNPSVVAVW